MRQKYHLIDKEAFLMKKLWMTNGTYDYLAELQKESDEIIIAQDEDQYLAVLENSGENPFSEAREYEVIGEAGTLSSKGFFVMNHIPVTNEGRPLFESRFKDRAGMIENEPGFQAFKLLRPHNNQTYVVLTQWEKESDFETWKNSQSFKQSHKSSSDKKEEKPSYSAGPSYAKKYQVIQPEDE